MALVDTLRQLIGASDTEYTIGEGSGGVTYWTDEQLDDVLDARSVLHTALVIRPRWERIDGEKIARYATIPAAGAFEPGTIGELRDSDGYAVNGGSGESWTVTQTGELALDPPLTTDSDCVTWTGYTFDLYAAAADVLGAWAVHVKDAVDITTDGQSIKQSQTVKNLSDRAEYFARGSVLSWVGPGRAHRV